MAGLAQVASAGGPNPGVMPINSHAFGKSYAVWGEEFNQWLWQFSLEEFPLFQPDGDVDCGIGQRGNVWFLYGAFGGAIERNCTIPANKAIFIAVNSVVSFVPEFGETEQEIREDAQKDLEVVDTLEAWIDGVPVNDPYGYRASSPEGGFVLSIEEGSILNQLGFDAGDRDPAIVDGYWLLLPPFSIGEHMVQWASSGVNQSGDYSYEVTWNLTVVD